MKILGISRSTRFSPNSVDRDAAIFAAVANRLNRGKNDVSVISEDVFIAVDLSEFDLVFSMARGKDVLLELAKAEEETGLLVVNSAKCLLENTRSRLVEKLTACGIAQPATKVFHLPLSNVETVFPLWLKRGDACAQTKTDVCYVSSPDELQAALKGFAERGVTELVAVEHAEGDLVKFYGVEGTDFFSYSYPTEEQGFSKFGLETHNGAPSHFAFSATDLKETADKAARESGFIVYGGDAIVRPDGSFLLIDFNDWPSFASCRKMAAKAIAQRISMSYAQEM